MTFHQLRLVYYTKLQPSPCTAFSSLYKCCFVVEKKLYLYKLTYSTERGEAKASHVSYKMNLPTGEEGGSNYDSFEGKRMKLVNVSV